jgi:integral membrane protein (TIGR01906 family)
LTTNDLALIISFVFEVSAMKIIRVVAFWLLLCCVPLLIISSNLRWGTTSLRLYEYGIDTYRISSVTGIDKSELMKVHQHLIDYYNSKVNKAQVTVMRRGEKIDIFNEKELIHLKDVKGLIQLDGVVQIVALIMMFICSLLLLLWLKEKWRIVIKSVLWGSVATLGFVIVLALWALFGFEQLFLLFHQVSFTNQFWILDPSKDYLIMLFPEEFFYDVVLFGFGAVIIESLILGGVAFGLLRRQS